MCSRCLPVGIEGNLVRCIFGWVTMFVFRWAICFGCSCCRSRGSSSQPSWFSCRQSVVVDPVWSRGWFSWIHSIHRRRTVGRLLFLRIRLVVFLHLVASTIFLRFLVVHSVNNHFFRNLSSMFPFLFSSYLQLSCVPMCVASASTVLLWTRSWGGSSEVANISWRLWVSYNPWIESDCFRRCRRLR